MINRELIRLKVLQLVYAYYQNEGKSIEMAEKELMFSFNKSYELYLYLLSLLVELRDYAERKDESIKARSERLGTHITGKTADAYFADNQLLKQLAANKALADYREKQKGDWLDEDAFVKKLYGDCIDGETFQFYLAKEDFSYEADREVVRKLYKTHICNNEDLDSLIEEHSLYWNDDKDIIDSFVLKTIKRFLPESSDDSPLLPMFASEDDRNFAITLFRATIQDGEEMRGLIRENCKNWSFNRLAFMDVIITQIALTEILNFPTIPLNVTFNEYLDIAKFYSTPHSSSYINGLLNGIVKKLKESGQLMK